MNSINELLSVKELLEAGRAVIAARASEQYDESVRKRQAVEQSWRSLCEAVRQDVPEVLLPFFDDSLPDGFEDQWGSHQRQWMIEFNVPSVGNVCRSYWFSDKWRPDSHIWTVKRWGMCYGDNAFVGTSHVQDWHKVTDLGEALAIAEIEEAMKKEIQEQVDAYNRRTAESNARREAVRAKEKTVGERLLDALEEYVRDSVDDLVGKEV